MCLLLALRAVPGAAQETVMEPPRVGQIDYYGLRRIQPEKIQREAGLSIGMALPPSQQGLVERIAGIKDVVQASVEAVCCEGKRAVLYVGIEEKGGARFEIREPAASEGTPLLTEDMLDAYRHLLEAMNEAARRGDTAEDITRGHSLLRDETARGWQLRLAQLAEPNLALLRQTLREGTEEERAVAACVIGYAETKSAVVNDLQFALRDPDPTVRANALRSLVPIAKLAGDDAAFGARVEYTWIVEMLHSVFFQDRQNAVKALLTLTETGGERARKLVHERGLESLAEMARWRHMPHALPAFLLLTRAAGMAEEEIQKQWVSGDRETAITKILRESKTR